jgi:hypothetical protein
VNAATGRRGRGAEEHVGRRGGVRVQPGRFPASQQRRPLVGLPVAAANWRVPPSGSAMDNAPGIGEVTRLLHAASCRHRRPGSRGGLVPRSGAGSSGEPRSGSRRSRWRQGRSCGRWTRGTGTGSRTTQGMRTGQPRSGGPENHNIRRVRLPGVGVAGCGAGARLSRRRESGPRRRFSLASLALAWFLPLQQVSR